MSKGSSLPNAIRALSMDAVQKAASGHPGAPMGMAEIAEVLWTDIMRHNPENPDWLDRDRFVLSNGHGSMLLYALLHLTGYDLSMEEIRNFRQLGSMTPGHPEYGLAPGVETTTGPLGQGLANAVGMAIAEKVMSAKFNREGFDVIDHHTYVFVGDGCLMEGVSHEAASLAGTLGLGKLICVYDDNGISIDGKVDGWFTDDTPRRFASYGWHVVPDIDGHDREAVRAAILAAREDSRPSIVCCRTEIGFGSPNRVGTASAHGSPLGADEVSLTREALDWRFAPFDIPSDIRAAWDCRRKGRKAENAWRQRYAEYASAHPALACELERSLDRRLPDDWAATMTSLMEEMQRNHRELASRSASGEVIARVAKVLPELLGGSADLSGSNCTRWPSAVPLSAETADANYIHYGVREFGMTAICNGIALHGGLRPFCGTFLVFMEYARNAARMSALMGIPNILVYTHDSIGLGEDGPTHQPVEQLANLRTTPDMSVWRPCDSVETVAAWRAAIERNSGPTALVFSRQALANQERTDAQLVNIHRGGYVIFESTGEAELVFIATGSEVSLAVAAGKRLAAKGRAVRVVSMPSTDVFEAQDGAYREAVLPSSLRKRVAVEASQVDYWRKWVGLDGAVVGMTGFGESAPGGALFDHFGFTVDKLIEVAEGML